MPKPPSSRATRLLHRTLRPVFGSTIGAVTQERLVALTFDDGPDPDWTPALLDALAALGAKATFFMVGDRAARHPELVARVAAEGHAVGNHSWDHPSLPSLSSAAVAEQLTRARAALAPHNKTHGGMLMRPPYGHQNLRTFRVARRLGYRPIFWNVSGGDWRGKDAETLAAAIVPQVAPGAIVLLHDSLYSFEDPAYRDRAPTIAAIGLLAERLPGYRFVTVPDLLRNARPRTRYWTFQPSAGELESLEFAEAT